MPDVLPGAGGHADVQVKSSSSSSSKVDAAPVNDSSSVKGRKAFSNNGLRGGVLPGSFIDILVQANDRTTGQALSDSQIASQVCLGGVCSCYMLIAEGQRAQSGLGQLA